MLGNKVTGDDFGPHPFGQLVTPVGRLGTKACYGFEEQRAPCGPERIGVVGAHRSGVRNGGVQQETVFARYAPRRQLGVVAQGDQVAFVGHQRVRAGIGGDHGCTGRIRVTQRRVVGVGQVKVGQAVVDQVHWCASGQGGGP